MNTRQMISLLMAARGMSNSELAKELGVTPSYISQILNGKRGIGPAMLRKLENVLGGPLDELEHKKYSQKLYNILRDEQSAYPRLATTKAIPLLSLEEVPGYIERIGKPLEGRKTNWLELGANDPLSFATTISSDENAPDLNPNSIVVISPSTSPSDGDYALVAQGDQFKIRRIKRVKKAGIVVWDNKGRDMEIYPSGKGIRIVGKVVTSIRNF